jgi:hypothetical protein
MCSNPNSRLFNLIIVRVLAFGCVLSLPGCGFLSTPNGTKTAFIFRVELTETASNLLQQQLNQGKNFYARMEIRKYDSGSGSGGSGGGTTGFFASPEFQLDPALPGVAYAAFSSSINNLIGAPYGAEIKLWLKVDSQLGYGNWSECGHTFYNGSDYVTWQVN